MISNKNLPKSLDFRSRKIVHYSLILCILLIQIIIVGFFYNEFINKKNLAFIEQQLKEIHKLDRLTDNSRKDLFNAQKYLQKYLINDDDRLLQAYFNSLDRLGKNLDSINRYQSKYPKLKNIITAQEKDSLGSKKLKVLIDSTYKYSVSSNLKVHDSLPKIKKYNPDYDIEKFEVQTKTYSDTVKKKGLLGRVGDAILGRVNVRKDSTVVTVKNGKALDRAAIKTEFDNILSRVNDHYTNRYKKCRSTFLKIRRVRANFIRFLIIF